MFCPDRRLDRYVIRRALAGFSHPRCNWVECKASEELVDPVRDASEVQDFEVCVGDDADRLTCRFRNGQVVRLPAGLGSRSGAGTIGRGRQPSYRRRSMVSRKLALSILEDSVKGPELGSAVLL